MASGIRSAALSKFLQSQTRQLIRLLPELNKEVTSNGCLLTNWSEFILWLIAAKFGAGAATGSMDYSKATYTGDGKTTIADQLNIPNLKRATDLNASQMDLAIISGTPKNENGADSFGIIWGGTGLTGVGISIYRDYDADILTVSMLRRVQLYATYLDGVPYGRIQFNQLPSGFTPYDPAFTALQPDYAKAMLRDANTYYTIGLFKFSNSVIDSQ